MLPNLQDDEVSVRLPNGAGLAIERAAIQARMRPSDLLRMIVIEGLASQGVQLAASGQSGLLGG